MLKSGAAIMLAVSFAAGARAEVENLPAILHCKISGSAGCSKNAEMPGESICVGAGTKESSVKLTIDTRKRQLVLNGIRGWVATDWRTEGLPLNSKERLPLQWTLSLIHHRWIFPIGRNEYRRSYFLILASDDHQLDFECRER